MPIRRINGLDIWQSELLLDCGVLHGFTGRRGGVSTGAYSSLSMSPRRGDDPSAVRKNEGILCAAAGLSLNRLTSTAQEHTDTVEIIDEPHVGFGISTPWEHAVDGVVTRLCGVPLLAYAADCVPLLFYADDIRAVAAVHSGWRGTEAKVAAKTAELLLSMGAAVKNLRVAIGPAIGKCCYEVSDDVALRFPSDCRSEKGDGKYMLDLKRANEKMLAELGIIHIDNSAPCTKCNNELFFSHRGQGGKCGTLAAFIQL